MAEHRALQAIKAAHNAIRAASTRAGDNVFLGGVSNIVEDDVVELNLGDDTPVNEFGTDNTETIDSNQRVYIDLHTRTSQHPQVALEQVFELRAQVHVALLADWTLGLPFVIAIRYLGTEPFEQQVVGDRVGSMRTVWDIAYRMEYADPAT